MKEISKISIVCAQGAETYRKGHDATKIVEEVRQIADNLRATFYIGYDRKDNEVFSISASCPIVIERRQS